MTLKRIVAQLELSHIVLMEDGVAQRDSGSQKQYRFVSDGIVAFKP
jgi:hypothetical protein